MNILSYLPSYISLTETGEKFVSIQHHNNGANAGMFVKFVEVLKKLIWCQALIQIQRDELSENTSPFRQLKLGRKPGLRCLHHRYTYQYQKIVLMTVKKSKSQRKGKSQQATGSRCSYTLKSVTFLQDILLKGPLLSVALEFGSETPETSFSLYRSSTLQFSLATSYDPGSIVQIISRFAEIPLAILASTSNPSVHRDELYRPIHVDLLSRDFEVVLPAGLEGKYIRPFPLAFESDFVLAVVHEMKEGTKISNGFEVSDFKVSKFLTCMPRWGTLPSHRITSNI